MGNPDPSSETGISFATACVECAKEIALASLEQICHPVGIEKSSWPSYARILRFLRYELIWAM